jgi:hypothetical protein
LEEEEEEEDGFATTTALNNSLKIFEQKSLRARESRAEQQSCRLVCSSRFWRISGLS